MYRTNAQSRAVEEAFIRRGVPYRLVGATRFYSRREIKDILAYMRLVHNPHDDISMRRMINTPPRRIGNTTLERLNQWTTRLDTSLYDGIRLLGGDAPADLTQRAGDHPFGGRARSSLLDFYAMLQDWIEARTQTTPAQLLDRILEESGYREWLKDGSDEGEDRWQNVMELRNVSTHYNDLPSDVALDAFLEEVALVSDTDDLETGTDVPTLLTLHSAKGLEFEVVFITGVEEGLLPHANALENPDGLEEERRLAYVGITRAKNRLYLLHTFRRTSWGRSDVSAASRFLGDIPRNLTGSTAGMRDAHRRMTTWGKDTRPRPGAGDGYQARLQFSPGQNVHHPQFGDGIVITSKRVGDDEEVSVAFAGKGVKRLLASFANLKTL